MLPKGNFINILLTYHSLNQTPYQQRNKINQQMSTLVSLLLAAVFNILGGEVPKETALVSKTQIIVCEQHSSLLTSNCIIKNEQLFKVKGIR